MDTTATAARAKHYAGVAHDTWKLGALTSTVFAEVTDLCMAAVAAQRQGDAVEADAKLDEAAAILDYLA